MVSIVDTAPLRRQLTLTNYAESSESCLHVVRISVAGTVLDDDAWNQFDKLSAEHQGVLNWQASSENLQNDVEVRDSLTQQSGRLCPSKNFSTAFYVNLKSDEGSLQRKIRNHPLSAYEQISFRSAMLTRHSAVDGQPELLALHDGLGGERSFLRWRSHDYIEVTLREPRKSFRVFWLIQWDIVGELRDTGCLDGAANPGRRRMSPLLRQASMTPLGKFHNVRLREKKRRSPWIAEVRPPGDRKKVWLGSYRTKQAAARAADAGSHYYGRVDMLNFRDSPRYLTPMPHFVSDKAKEDFVKHAAHELVDLIEMQPSPLHSTRDPDNQTPYSTGSNEFTWDDTQQVGTLDTITQLVASPLGEAFDVQLFTSCNGNIFRSPSPPAFIPTVLPLDSPEFAGSDPLDIFTSED